MTDKGQLFRQNCPGRVALDCGKDPWLDAFADNIADGRREETE
jgi:hypothetical protein